MSSESIAALPAAASPARRLSWRQRLTESVVAYLPLMLMALLALGSWWLVNTQPVTELPAAQAALRHEPDYTMRSFVVQRFAADGSMRAQIEGDLALHFPDTDTVEIENPRMRAITPSGRVLRASARRALANGDASEVQLLGAAHVTREAGATAADGAIDFHSEFLQVFVPVERVRSQRPVTVTQGQTVVHANGMAYDNLARTIDLTGPMHAVFAAPGRASPR